MADSKTPAADDPQRTAADIKPDPSASGSDGSQSVPEASEGALVRLVQPLSIDQSHLGAALGELSEVRSPAVMALAIAAYRDADQFRKAVMERWDAAEREKVQLRESYYQEREKNSVLEERQRGRTRLRRVQ